MPITGVRTRRDLQQVRAIHRLGQVALGGLQGFDASNVEQGTDNHAIIGKSNHKPRPEQERHFGMPDFVLLSVGQAHLERFERLPPQ